MKLFNIRLLSLLFVLFLAVILTLPVLSKIPQHPDEYQFYVNAFQMMAGKPLNNYLHVATTEYVLAGFLSVANLFTDTGVNFPQGDPSNATYFYGRILGFMLYLLGFIFSFILLQRNDSRIKIRTAIFAILYFSSLGVFERFLRINSDSMMVLIFLNFGILSLEMHFRRSSTAKFFILNTLFVFLQSFTNIKGLYLIAPFLILNTVCPYLFYEKHAFRLPVLYRLVWYGLGIVTLSILLWVVFMPKPFDHIRFWYGIKQTIVHGTGFDFDYPSQARNSGIVYLYDLLAECIGLPTFGVLVVLFMIGFIYRGRKLLIRIKQGIRNQLNLDNLRSGNLYASLDIIMLACFIFYWFGVSSRIIHWSRWGIPLGITSFFFISTLAEKLIEELRQYLKTRISLGLVLAPLFIIAWVLRFFLTFDLQQADYPKNNGFTKTRADVDSFLQEKNLGPQQVTWFTGYTNNVKTMSLEQLVEPENKDIKYVLWPYWNLGAVYEKSNVNLDDANLRRFITDYAVTIEYRFPSYLSRYAHLTKLFAWRYLKVTWNPEIDSLVENQYAAVKLPAPVTKIAFNYTVGFSDMAHYHFPYSLIFNKATLKDGYIFPPCYTYPNTRYISDGQLVGPPKDFGVGSTAGLYCHSLRFRVFLKGLYYIHIDGLPDNLDSSQILYFNLGNFLWDAKSKTALLYADNTRITAEFGVATKERTVPDLKYTVYYQLPYE